MKFDAEIYKGLGFLQDFLRCNRRNQAKPLKKKSTATPRKKSWNASVESDDVLTSTDYGDVSRTDREGSDRTRTNTSGSDTDSQMFFRGQREFQAGLNPKAANFVPMNGKTAASDPNWRSQTKCVDENSLRILQESINTLSPQGAAMVRAYLDNKDLEAKPQFELVTDAVNYGSSTPTTSPIAAAAPWRNQLGAERREYRAFKPFQGNQMKMPKQNPPRSKPGDIYRDSASSAPVEAESLRSHLRELASIDSARVLMVRKIGGLGMDAGDALHRYFSKFGTVERVMLSQTHSKTESGHIRTRMATTSFVVMVKAEEATAVLGFGKEHKVQGVTISVALFQSHPIAGESKDDEAN